MKFLSIAVLALVAGCASKPPMPDSQAQTAANGWYATHSCVASGYMPPETGAMGRNFISKGLATFGDTSAFRTHLDSLNTRRPEFSRADCSTAAMMILEIQGRQTAHQAAAPAQIPHMPTFTTCNKAFGQVSCTTY